MVPWLVFLGVCGTGAVALDGVERALAVGAFSASCFGALIAISQIRGAVISMRGWMGGRDWSAFELEVEAVGV